MSCNVSAEKSADCLIGVPLYVTSCFSFAALILSFYLFFVILIIMCLGVTLFGFILFGTLCASWTWMSVSFSRLGRFSTIMSTNMALCPFLFLFSFRDPYHVNVSRPIIPVVSFKLSSFLFTLFLFSFSDFHSDQ